MQNDRYIVGPEKLKELAATGQIYTGTGALQNDHYSIRPPIPEPQAAETAFFVGTGAVINARTHIDLALGDTQLEATATARTGCGIVENTHYIVQSQGGT